jgi:hypothetical protein
MLRPANLKVCWFKTPWRQRELRDGTTADTSFLWRSQQSWAAKSLCCGVAENASKTRGELNCVEWVWADVRYEHKTVRNL